MDSELKKYKNIYFLGVGGVGMSGLAAWCSIQKYHVLGYDREQNDYTEKLKSYGVKTHHNLLVEEIPDNYLNNQETLVVYTPAIKTNHLLYDFFYNKNFRIIKRAQLLKIISSNYHVIAIAGTHGKTTISIMLSHLLKNAGYNPNAFFGGISKNTESNFLIGSDKYMIIEADEYDQSFLELNPIISLITAIDKDHVDTYSSEDDLFYSYYQFFINTCNSYINYLNSEFSDFIKIEKTPVFMPKNVKKVFLDYVSRKKNDNPENTFFGEPSEITNAINLDMSSLSNMCNHNLQNALLAAKLASVIGLKNSEIEAGFKNFKGVKRRFEYHVKTDNLILIDDYAHHPKELDVLIHSVRKLYPKLKLFLIFQPHLFSRTLDLEKDFSIALSSVDKLALLDIYGARENPIEGVSSKKLLQTIDLKYKWHIDFKSIEKLLKIESPNLVVTAGAGDVYKLIPLIKKSLMS